jgi:hypothetical protein
MKTSDDGKTYPCECGEDHGILTLCNDSSDARRGWVSRKIEDAKPKAESILESSSREADPVPSTAPPKVIIEKREIKHKLGMVGAVKKEPHHVRS